jgi:hypothetical protein
MTLPVQPMPLCHDRTGAILSVSDVICIRLCLCTRRVHKQRYTTPNHHCLRHTLRHNYYGEMVKTTFNGPSSTGVDRGTKIRYVAAAQHCCQFLCVHERYIVIYYVVPLYEIMREQYNIKPDIRMTLCN